jgi:hypothetical protein
LNITGSVDDTSNNDYKMGFSPASVTTSDASTGGTKMVNVCYYLGNRYSVTAYHKEVVGGSYIKDAVNAGSGKELTIKALTELVAKVVGYEGVIEWDTTRPNGTPRKLLDVSKAKALGWTYRTELEDGIRLAYDDFLNNPMRAER